MVKFRDQLRDELKKKKDSIPDELISLLPSGFQTIDFAAIVNLKPELYDYKTIIAEKIMELLPAIKAVWIRKGIIKGQFRKPSGLEYIAGIKDTEVELKENNIRYFFDFTEIMFAKGNVAERKYLPSLVRDGEIIVDMFAGIGYFSLGMAKFSKPNKIYSIELNPISYKYLKKNIEKNKVSNIIEPIHGDTKEEVPKLAEKGIIADRIVMGVFPAPYEYISAAISVAKKEELEYKTNFEEFIEKSQETFKYNVYKTLPKISNTIIHFEGVSMGRDITELYNNFEKEVHKYSLKCALLAFRFVKSFGPKMWHITLDIAVGK